MENNEIKLNKNLYEEIAKRGTFTSYYNVPIEEIPVVEKPYLRGYETAEDYQKEMMAKSIEEEQPVSVEKFIEEPKCYNPVQEVKVEKIDLGPLPQSAPNSGVILGDSKLPWMVGKRGKYLDFFRGLIMYDKDGNEVVDVFDGTEKHHGPRIYEIARDNFNTTIINEQLPMQNAEHANNEGITVLLLEGTTMQIYLPEKISKETIEEIIKENIPHGDIWIGFTPDEEVGAGADYFDVKLFGADYAYTVDGGKLGELEYENFNAAGAKVTFHGRSVHPGDAKNKMVNALLLAMEFQNMLPVFENPMYTEKYEGFYHLDLLSGSVEKAQAEYIIRDHDKDKFKQKKETFLKIGDYLNEKYGKDTVLIEMKDSYYNMREIIEQHMQLIENAKAAMEETGVNPIVVPIRGGTDGARLSYMGLPCPNLCTGGHNFHGRFEYICADSMEKIVEILLKLAMKK